MLLLAITYSAMLFGKGHQHHLRYVGNKAWLKDSKSYIMELCRRAIGPESLIHYKYVAM